MPSNSRNARRPTGASRKRQAVRNVVEALDVLDLEVPGDVRDRLERGEYLATAHRSASSGFDELRDAAARRLVDGEIDVEEATDLLVEAQRRSDRDGAAMIAVARAADLAAGAAWHALEQQGPALFSLLAGAVDQAVAEAATLAGKLPPTVDSDAAALRAGQAARDAWGRLSELADRIGAAHALAGTLRSLGVIPAGDVWGPLNADLYRYRHDELLPPRAKNAAVHPVRFLLDAIAAGAEPALLSAADVEAIDRQRAADEDARRVAGRVGSGVFLTDGEKLLDQITNA